MYEIPFGDEGGSGDLDKMRLALLKQNKPVQPPQPQPLSSQIPGYGKPVPPAQTTPSTNSLEAAAGNFTTLATNFNPLMMAKSMREAAGLLTVPPVAAVKGVAESLFTSPPGTYTSGKAPAYAEKVAKEFMTANAPQTPMTQEFAGAIAPYMESLPAYIGHLQTGRPAFTPNDLRVMGAEATRVGRQVKDIPTDFVNAQSGLQKLDPITGQPTYGAKLQGVAESVGDIMAQREMQGLPPVPGLPASMQPMNPKLYAMRPSGSRLVTATMPATAKQDAATYSPAQDLVSSVISDTTITPVQALNEIQSELLGSNRAAPARVGFTNFIKQKANEMYPDAPSPEAALNAYKARFGNKEASAAHTLGLYDEFLQTPEGLQFKTEYNLPTAEELPARHEAAANWLNSQFTNYINEKVGTPDEPAAKLASQGLTFNPPDEVLGYSATADKLAAKRTAAGMPAKTATDLALADADQKLISLQEQTAEALNRKREQTQAAIDAGYGAPGGPNLGQFEPLAQASREAAKLTTAYNKQRQLVDNLRLGTAYEGASDIAINASTAKGLKEDIDYAEQQFYPTLMQTPDTERVYTASTRQLRNLGFETLAKSFYNDVMSGKIPLDKVPKLTVEKYIRSVAEERITKEKAEQAKVAEYKNAVDRQFKASADAHIPNDKVFGNVGALEITNRFKPKEVAKLVSEDTTALDVCIGEGGNTDNRPNLWHPGTGNRQYEPIYNVATGELNPNAPSPRKTYINAVKDGSQVVSFRDTVTGEPIAVFDFNPSSLDDKYNIYFASGRKNGKIKPEYVDGIKAYLNSRADSIHDVGTNLYNTTGISDSKRTASRTLAGMINMPASQFERYDISGLPRFITTPDLRNYIEELKANEPVEQVPAVMSQRPSESLESYVTGAMSSAIDNVLDSQRRAFEEAGEGGRLQNSEDFFADIRGFFNEALREQGAVEALVRTKQHLYDLESQYANSNRVSANIIADGIQDLIGDLQGHINYAIARQAAEAGQQRTRPRAIAVQGDPMPELDAEDLITWYSERLSPEQSEWLDDFLERWDGEEGSTDAGQEGLIDEYARWRSVNRLAPLVTPDGRPDYLRMTHNAAMELDRQFGDATGDEMRGAIRAITEGSGIDPANNTDQFITSLRGAAEVAARESVEIALNELADQMESVYMRDWEPEEAPAAPAQPFDFARLVDGIVDEVSRNANPGVGNRVDTIAYRVAERVNPRLDPEGYARALRQIRTDTDHVAVGPALRALADRIYLERFPEEPAQAQQPVNYRPATQDQASAALMQINHEIGTQARFLADEHNAATTQLFAANLGRLYSENNLNAIGDTPGSLNRFGNYLQGFRNDLAAQIPDLNRSGFQGEAAASAIQNVINAVDTQLANFRVRGADLDNQRNDAIFQLENAVNDPELNPDDLRMMANGLSNPVDQTANSPWISLTDAERRMYAQALRERANYIEFSPADFAIRLSNEAGADIPDLRDTVQALNDGTFDHEILRGLPDMERNRAAQRTALNLNHILQGMQADANRAPAVTPRQQAINARVPRITDMLIEFSEDDPIATPADYRRIANILRDPRNAREFLEEVMGVGDSLGDFTLRTTDLQRSTLGLVADELERRADLLNNTPATAPRNLRGFTDDELRNQISVMETDTGGVWQRVNDAIDRRLGAARRQGLDPNLEANDIRNGFGLTADITPVEREYIAREVADTLQLDAQRAALNPNGVPPAPERVAEDLRDAAEDLVNGLEEAYYTDTPNPRAAIRLIRQHLRALRRNGEMAFEDIMGMASTAYEWSPELLTALEVELESLIERYQGMDGFANGGLVQGYQKGGSVKKPEVKTPWLFSVPTYSETVAFEMYPGQRGQDDQRDAARHMLAAGTLSRKYGAGPAEFIGKAHEYVTSPLQAVKSMFTGKMPADFDMDTHNNRIGAQLGQRAKSQAELEDLVQEEAERASRTQTSDKAFIKKANGGIVQQNPTTDQMRHALMMRRK